VPCSVAQLRSACCSICRMRSRVTFELLAHLLQRMVRVARADAEPPPEDLFSRRSACSAPADLEVQVVPDGELEGRCDLLVLDEIAQMAVLFLADGRFEGDGAPSRSS